MAFPSIKPIVPGRDGWSVLYDTEVSRLLFLCGLRPKSIRYSSAQRRTLIDWNLTESVAQKFITYKRTEK